jgi:5-methylthioadenosine/S-adenosylhomocysteine deaminase
MGLFLKDCDWVITQNPGREVLRNSSVSIDDNGTIRDMGITQGSRNDEVIDCSGKALIPGLINTHTHLSMTLFRGYADDLELQQWLEKKIWPLEKKLTGDMCYNGALLGAMEMTRTGTTCFVDMYFHMEDVARATDEAGLRGILSYGVIDPPNQEGKDRERKNSLKLLQLVRAMKSPRISFAFGPHSPYTCGEDTLLWCRKEADKENVLVNIHIAETRGEQAKFERSKKMREADYLDKIGFLNDKVLAAHSVWLTKSEVKLYGKRGVRVAHCPVSNMKLAGGSVAPLPEMWEAGVPVGLGTDGPASNNSLDMFDTMKVCALAHKAHRWDPTMANAQKVLDMATIDGARAIGKENEIGSIEKGKQADLVLVDLREPNMMPIHGKETVISDLVYSASGYNVDTTIVDGRVLMRGRKYVRLDPANIEKGINESVRRLVP